MTRLAFKSWLTRRCVTCRAPGRHAVIFGRPRCLDCRKNDLVFLRELDKRAALRVVVP